MIFYTRCNIFTVKLLFFISKSRSHESLFKVRKRAKIKNRYNQAPHLTQDINGKVTTSQLDITNESQEVSPFPAGDLKASTNRRALKHNKTKQKNILLEGLNRFNGVPTSPLVQMWIKTHRYQSHHSYHALPAYILPSIYFKRS